MSLDSVVNDRLFQWFNACEAWGFEINPQFSEDTLAALAPGEVSFRAKRTATNAGASVEVSLTVSEAWFEGADPAGDRRLERELSRTFL